MYRRDRQGPHASRFVRPGTAPNTCAGTRSRPTAGSQTESQAQGRGLLGAPSMDTPSHPVHLPEERVQFHEARLLCRADITAVQRAARTLMPTALRAPRAAEMWQWEHGGAFALDAGVRIEAADRKGLESQGQGWPCLARRGCSDWSVIAPASSCQ